MRNLETMLVNDFGLGAELAGWTLSQASGISADGTRIVGYGFNPSGIQEAFITIIPEPATLLLLSSGLVGLAGRYRRRRQR